VIADPGDSVGNRYARDVSTDAGQTPRRLTGAAVRRPEVTESIRTAVIEELASIGYGQLSIESVARRAKVGKTTIYRRWPSKQDMVVAVISEIAWTHVDAPDTGSLRGDVEEFLTDLASALDNPVVRSVATDLLAEAHRDSPLTANLIEQIRDPRRARAAKIVRRAMNRGEVSDQADVGLALDLLAGPLLFRSLVLVEPYGNAYKTDLAKSIVAGLEALGRT
jgi:AcrR family transcriptional regulator